MDPQNRGRVGLVTIMVITAGASMGGSRVVSVGAPAGVGADGFRVLQRPPQHVRQQRRGVGVSLHEQHGSESGEALLRQARGQTSEVRGRGRGGGVGGEREAGLWWRGDIRSTSRAPCRTAGRAPAEAPAAACARRRARGRRWRWGRRAPTLAPPLLPPSPSLRRPSRWRSTPASTRPGPRWGRQRQRAAVRPAQLCTPP